MTPAAREPRSVCLPAAVSKHAVSFLKELAGHGCRGAAGQVVGVAAVVAFFAEPVHEVPGNPKRRFTPGPLRLGTSDTPMS